MDQPKPKRAKLSKRTPAELSHLAILATGSVFIAERYPNDLIMCVALVSQGHRENMREAKRDINKLNVNDVVQNVASLEAAVRVSPSLGLPPVASVGRHWFVPGSVRNGFCMAAVRAGHVDVLARAIQLGCHFDAKQCWRFAIEHGQIAAMAWLREHHAPPPPANPRNPRARPGWMWNSQSCSDAAQHGQLARRSSSEHLVATKALRLHSYGPDAHCR